MPVRGAALGAALWLAGGCRATDAKVPGSIQWEGSYCGGTTVDPTAMWRTSPSTRELFSSSPRRGRTSVETGSFAGVVGSNSTTPAPAPPPAPAATETKFFVRRIFFGEVECGKYKEVSTDQDAVCLETPPAAVHGGPAAARIVAEEAGFGNENDDALVVPIVIMVDAKAASRLQSRTQQGRVHKNDDEFFPSPQHASKNVTVGRFRYSRAHTPIVTEFFPKKIVGDDTLQIHGHRLGNALAFLSEQAVGNPIPKWRGACKEIHHFDQAGFLPRRRQLALECRAPAATSGRALLEVVDAKFGRACFAGPLEGNKKPPLLQVESAGLSKSPLQQSGAFLQYDLRLSYARKLDERVDRLASATQRLGLLVEEHGREDGTAASPAPKSVAGVGRTRRMSMKTREKNALPSQFAESTDREAKGSFGGGNFLRLVGQGFAPDDVIYVCGQPCSGGTQNAILAATTASLFSGAGAGSSPSGASEFSAGAASSRTRLAAAAGSGSSSGSSSAHHKPIRTTTDSTAQNTGDVAPAAYAAPLLFPESVVNLVEIQAERGELHQGVASFQSRVCETPAYVPPPPVPAQPAPMFSAYSFSGAGSLSSGGNIMQPIRGSGSSSIGGSGSASGSGAAAGSGVGSASVVSMASTGGFPETPFPASKTCDVRILSRATGILTELRDAFRYDATLTPMLTSVERKSADVILITAGKKLSGDLTRVFWNDLECENVAVDAADGDDDVDEERESARKAKEVAKDAAARVRSPGESGRNSSHRSESTTFPALLHEKARSGLSFFQHETRHSIRKKKRHPSHPPKTVPGSAHAVRRRLKKAARKLFRNHPLIRKMRAAFRRKRLKARFVDTLEELVSDIAGVPHKRMRRRFRRRIRKLRAPTSGSSTAPPPQRTPLPVKKKPTAEQESALKYVVRRKVQKDPAQGVRLVVSCPGMFATAGKVRVYEPMVGFAFEGAPGMTGFPALNQDTDGGKRARPDFLPKEPAVKRANFNPVESYAGRKCAAAEHDCPPGWQCCPRDDGGSHCSPTCLA